MVKLQDKVIDKLIEVGKNNGVSFLETRRVYLALFDFLIKEFSQISDQDISTWDKNVIIKNFGKFVVNKNKLKRYESKRKINEQSNELTK
jgi:type IV secretory pathway protease TraF